MEVRTVLIKVGRNTLRISANDIILDNGATYQIITKEVGGFGKEQTPAMSKKLFNEFKQAGFVFTSELMKHSALTRYGEKSGCTFWKFNMTELSKHDEYRDNGEEI
jgi:hypothetical protein